MDRKEKLAMLQKLSEKELTKKFLIPFYESEGMGCKNVRYTHRKLEFGKDIIYYKDDEYGNRIYTGVQVKRTKIATRNVDNIFRQISEAFGEPFTYLSNGKKHDLDIATEAFGISYDVMSTSDMLENIFSMVKNSPLYFVGDSANSCYGGESSVVAIEKFWDRLRHVHIKDVKETQEGTGYPAKGDRWLGQAELGTGIAGIKEFTSFLKTRSYNGWYSLETYLTDSLEVIGEYANTLKELL